MKEATIKKENEERLNMASIVLKIAELLKDKRAKDILVLNLYGLTNITDYFIICTVNSITQTKAIVRYIEELSSSYNLKPLTKNLDSSSPWVLLDYNYFVIHIFLKESRDYYQIERLWSDAKIVYSDKGSEL